MPWGSRTTADRPSPEELRELARLTLRFVPVTEALLAYVKAVSARGPCPTVAGYFWDGPNRGSSRCWARRRSVKSTRSSSSLSRWVN